MRVSHGGEEDSVLPKGGSTGPVTQMQQASLRHSGRLGETDVLPRSLSLVSSRRAARGREQRSTDGAPCRAHAGRRAAHPNACAPDRRPGRQARLSGAGGSPSGPASAHRGAVVRGHAPRPLPSWGHTRLKTNQQQQLYGPSEPCVGPAPARKGTRELFTAGRSLPSISASRALLAVFWDVFTQSYLLMFL